MEYNFVMKVTTIETKHVFAVKLVVNPADRAELCSPDASMPDGLLGGEIHDLVFSRPGLLKISCASELLSSCANRGATGHMWLFTFKLR